MCIYIYTDVFEALGEDFTDLGFCDEHLPQHAFMLSISEQLLPTHTSSVGLGTDTKHTSGAPNCQK